MSIDKTIEVVGTLDTELIRFNGTHGKLFYINPDDVRSVVFDPSKAGKYDSDSCLVVYRGGGGDILLHSHEYVYKKLTNRGE